MRNRNPHYARFRPAGGEPLRASQRRHRLPPVSPPAPFAPGDIAAWSRYHRTVERVNYGGANSPGLRPIKTKISEHGDDRHTGQGYTIGGIYGLSLGIKTSAVACPILSANTFANVSDGPFKGLPFSGMPQLSVHGQYTATPDLIFRGSTSESAGSIFMAFNSKHPLRSHRRSSAKLAASKSGAACIFIGMPASAADSSENMERSSPHAWKSPRSYEYNLRGASCWRIRRFSAVNVAVFLLVSAMSCSCADARASWMPRISVPMLEELTCSTTSPATPTITRNSPIQYVLWRNQCIDGVSLGIRAAIRSRMRFGGTHSSNSKMRPITVTEIVTVNQPSSVDWQRQSASNREGSGFSPEEIKEISQRHLRIESIGGYVTLLALGVLAVARLFGHRGDK